MSEIAEKCQQQYNHLDWMPYHDPARQQLMNLDKVAFNFALNLQFFYELSFSV
jgi:hypothetical protein